MESSGLSNGGTTLNDVMHRRLKNRERQRRYRQRKRSEVGSGDARVTNPSSQMEIVSLPTNGTSEQFVTRVHCKRDWKKDARRVHAVNVEATSNGVPSKCQSLSSNNHTPHASLTMQEEEQTSKKEACSESYSRSGDTDKIIGKRRRRDWKAEARQKK